MELRFRVRAPEKVETNDYTYTFINQAELEDEEIRDHTYEETVTLVYPDGTQEIIEQNSSKWTDAAKYTEDSNKTYHIVRDTELKPGKESDAEGPVREGDTIVYTIRVTNPSTLTVRDVTVSDPIPEGTTYIKGSATGNGLYHEAENKVTWQYESLAPGQTVTVKFSVTVDKVPEGERLEAIRNVAEVTKERDVPVPPPEEVVDPVVRPEKLSYDKDGNLIIGTVREGQLIEYVIRITSSDKLEEALTVIDKLPSSGLSIVPGSITMQLGSNAREAVDDSAYNQSTGLITWPEAVLGFRVSSNG